MKLLQKYLFPYKIEESPNGGENVTEYIHRFLKGAVTPIMTGWLSLIRVLCIEDTRLHFCSFTSIATCRIHFVDFDSAEFFRLV